LKGISLVAALLVALLILGSSFALAAEDSPAEGDEEGPNVELPGKRTATSNTFRLPNGALKTKIYETQVNYETPSGDWQPIDERLLEQTDGTGLTNGANAFDLSLPEQMGAGPVRMSVDDEWISYRLLGPTASLENVEGATASYESQAGVAFVLESLSSGVKETIVLADASQPSSFDFELDVATGLIPSIEKDGSLQVRDQDEEVFAMLPAPNVTDASSAQPNAGAVSYSLSEINEGKWRLTVAVDKAWLGDPDRAWPVAIDPTALVPKSYFDCSIGKLPAPNGTSSCSWSPGVTLDPVEYNPKEGATRRDLFAWSDLSAIPSGASIYGATIGLYAPAAAENTSTLEMLRVTHPWGLAADWTRSSVFFGEEFWTTPGGDYSSAYKAEVKTSERGSQAGWWNFSSPSLTDLVSGWFTKAIPNNGVLVKHADETKAECEAGKCNRRYVAFHAGGYATTEHPPYLEVTYYPPAPATSKVITPTEGAITPRRLKLKAAWSASTPPTGITFQYRKGKTGTFASIPTGVVQDAKGQAIAKWPVAVSGTESAPLYFDTASVDEELRQKGGPIQIRALFDSGNGVGYSEPVSATVDPNVGAALDATTSVGPGSVDLLTGNFTLTRTDVSIATPFGSSLEFARTASSRKAVGSGDAGVLGRGWSPAIAIEAQGGSEWRGVREVVLGAAEHEEGLSDYAILTDLEGYEYAFEKQGAGYVSPPEMPGWTLARQEYTFTLSDPEGGVTTFGLGEGSPEFLPASVSMPGASSNSARMIYQFVNGNRRLDMAIAPSQGIDCTTALAITTVGCRVLKFVYEPASKWGAPGSFQDRLSKIVYYGPTSGTSMSNWEVARYKYDSAGRLIEEWDPRISPSLIETYGYTGAISTYEAGQVRKITPPGQSPWSIEYQALSGELTNNGRLRAVSRPSLLPAPNDTATTTVVYRVPLSGSEAPYSMSSSAVSQWAQHDIPFDATAIFPPDEVPKSPTSAYTRALLYYTDGEGQLVNTLTPSGGGTLAPSIATTERDEHGNVVRELTAQNRLRALAAENPAIRSQELETSRVYSADGAELSEELGPLHEVRLASGASVEAKMHRVVKYDEGWPGTGVKPHLPTREVVGARSGTAPDVDTRTTETKYDWALRKPTETIIDPSGLNLHTSITYEPKNGLPIARTLPGGSTGGDAHTTKMVYYSAFNYEPGHEKEQKPGLCYNNRALIGLPCEVTPAAQPGTPGQPDLVVKKFLSYSPTGQPTEVVESASGQTRTIITSYDAAGREILREIQGGGSPLPATETLYHPTLGLPTTQRLLVCQSEGQCNSTGAPQFSGSFGSFGSGNGQFNTPRGVASDKKGHVWVVDRANNRVEEFNEKGEYLGKFGSFGSGNGQFNNPWGIAVAPNGHLWVADTGNYRIQEFNEKGEFLQKFGTKATAGSKGTEFVEPEGIAVAPGGMLWVSDGVGARVAQFRETVSKESERHVRNVSTTGTGNPGLVDPLGVAVDPSGNLWVIDAEANRLLKYSSEGAFIQTVGSQGSADGQFNGATGLAISPVGNILVGDSGNNRVQEFNPAGTFLYKLGTKGSGSENLSGPRGVALGAGNTVFIVDKDNSRVQRATFDPLLFDRQATTTTYDSLGRVTEYEDADNNVSKTTYDLLSRPVTSADSMGTQTRAYDSVSGLLVSLEDSAAGTFTASYDADGNLVEQGLPNGLMAKTTYDEVGAPNHLTYTKTTNCSLNCTWLDFDAERSISGQILSEGSLTSTQRYSYDKAGRLTVVNDTPTGGACTTRAYSYDADSNRTALVTRAPGIGGACATSGGTTHSYSYDAADRLTDSGIAYDNFGRTTSLPAIDAGGGTLTTNYYSNDMVQSQTQDGLTNSYQLDAAMRPRLLERTKSGKALPTEVMHYAGATDSPSWTETSAGWTRYIGGIGGELAAIQDSAVSVSLQLSDLHGDIVATASLDAKATALTASFEFDEFGNPTKGTPGRFGWLGGKQRRAELPSGVIQMGVRSYVPAVGRFISVDPVTGGSANAYDYANADPVNGFDLDGRAPCKLSVQAGSRRHKVWANWSFGCSTSKTRGWPSPMSIGKRIVKFERHTKGLKDEILHGKFETKKTEEDRSPNGRSPNGRRIEESGSWHCGDIGRTYQIVVELWVTYQMIGFESKQVKYKEAAQVTCQG
jgi:RHS repeat-associated protein